MSRLLLAALLVALIHIFTPMATAESLTLTYSSAFHDLHSIDDLVALKGDIEREGCQVMERGIKGSYTDNPTLGWLARSPAGIRGTLFRMDRTEGDPFYITFPASFVEASLVCLEHGDASGAPTVDFFDGRQILDHAPTSFPMHLIQPPVRAHILVFSHTGPVLPLSFLSIEAKNNAVQYDKVVFFFLIGSLFALLIYNLFLFLGAKKAAYKFNAFYILWSMFLNVFQGWGYLIFLDGIRGMPWEEAANRIFNATFTAGIMVGSVSALAFLIAFTETKAKSPKLHRVLQVNVVIGLVLGVIIFAALLLGFERSLFLRATRTFPFVAMILIFFSSGYLAFRKKDVLGWLFFIPITFLVGGTLIIMISFYGVIGLSTLARYSLLCGTVTESLLLSLSVGIKVRLAEKDAARKIQEFNVKLQELNESLERQVEVRTRDIRSIMATIQQGILMVETRNEHVYVGDEVSHYSQQILGFDPRGKLLKEAIFLPSNMSADGVAAAEAALLSTIGEDVTFLDSNLHLLPRELLYTRSADDDRRLEMEWSFVEMDEAVQKSILVLRDVTEEQKTKARLLETEGDLAIVIAAVQKGEKLTRTILEDVRKLGQKAEAALVEEPSAEAWNHVKRHMHTAKGLLRSAGQGHLASRLHQVEDELQQKPEAIKAAVESFQQIGALGLAVVQRFLGWNGAEDAARVTRASLLEILENPLRGLADAARMLEKDEPEVQLQGPTYESLFSPQMAQALTEVFTHAFRNSIDHGIENPSVRQQRGKTARGAIGIQLTLKERACRLVLRDDGRGLNLGRLRAVANLSAQTDADVADVIFRTEVSTQDRVTEISGRGVGLYAARAALREINADIQVEFTGPTDQDGFRSFQFVITAEVI